MKALELLKSQESILLEDSNASKKIQGLSSTLNSLIIEMNSQLRYFEDFASSQLNGDYNDKIVVAKSLAKFFEGNKTLKVELAVQAFEAEEKARLNDYYSVKTRLLDTIKTIINTSNKEAVVSNYDLFEGDFVKCEPGHEIIILNGRNLNVLETLLAELDRDLIVNGNFASIEAQNVDYNLDILNRNIELCTRKNNEIYGSKTGKLNKITNIIDRLREVGDRVVAFYTYKDSLEVIGCNPKGIKDYENELSKAYIPLKKTLQKELRIELEDICNVIVDETAYDEVNVDDSEFSSPLANMNNTTSQNYYGENDTATDSQIPTTYDNTTYAQEETQTYNTPNYENVEEQDNTANSSENFEQSTYETMNSTNPYNVSPEREDPFETASNNTPDPFENEEKPNPFENTQTASPFESVQTTNPFENTPTASPFENARPYNPFDNAVNTDPFENTNTPSSYTEDRRNPFDDLN